MDKLSTIKRIIKGQLVSEGAGVRLQRIFGFYEEGLFDPFLLCDFFGSENPNDYIAGFPWHPHRGIETVTYMIEGKAEHGDSMGNKGVIGSGDLQWMTAGSGIIHQEMPKPENGRMFGFQLWVNLPSSNKMMQPRYQDIPANQLPVITLENNIIIKVLAGFYKDLQGPVKDIVAEPCYLDITMPQNTNFEIEVNPEHTVFVVVFDGNANFDEAQDNIYTNQCALFNSGARVKIKTSDSQVRFILVSGKPLNEPIAWRGPIVMNTQEELAIAFKELRDETFIKKH